MLKFILLLLPTSVFFLSIKEETFSYYSNDNNLFQKAIEAKKYCKNNNLDTSVCVLINMKIPSGKNRFFVYDMVNDSVSMQGNVCNGMYSAIRGTDSLRFSNTRVAHCTSLGKYLITERGYSDYGIHVNYKLLGLEKTNSNAESRIVVLHSKDEVADNEIYPQKLVTSKGCPTVSNAFMKKLDALLKPKKNNVLLWIFY